MGLRLIIYAAIRSVATLLILRLLRAARINCVAIRLAPVTRLRPIAFMAMSSRLKTLTGATAMGRVNARFATGTANEQRGQGSG